MHKEKIKNRGLVLNSKRENVKKNSKKRLKISIESVL